MVLQMKNHRNNTKKPNKTILKFFNMLHILNNLFLKKIGQV